MSDKQDEFFFGFADDSNGEDENPIHLIKLFQETLDFTYKNDQLIKSFCTKENIKYIKIILKI